ncbi:thymidine phosphorylase [Candidatus Acetothermia bacterium]|nr:thymidine phosphorylase [Candidatus Acetothermia bacterium]
METVELIRKKRDGEKLSYAELEFLVRNFVAGKIPDYQMAAFCMAVYFRSMDAHEMADLTQLMADSGDKLDLDEVDGFVGDKHSNGGVGDKVSLVLGPLVASCGLYIAKLSGRGLGHTGGTIDKLESIPGIRVQLSLEEFKRCVQTVGLAIGESTLRLAPADQKIYALRDVTASVDSLPLIVSSILSKKLVIDSDGIVFDVKVGIGTTMPTLPKARELAKLLVSISKRCGRRASALITDMDQPLGYNVGNILELREAVATLSGHGPADLEEVVVRLGAELLIMAKKARTADAATQLLRSKLQSGEGLQKLSEMVRAQGGNASVLTEPHRLSSALEKVEIRATKPGYVHKLNARMIGEAAHLLGAGRMAKGEAIDPAVGVELYKKRGDSVKRGEPLACLHVNERVRLEEALTRARGAYEITRAKPKKVPMVHDRIA